MTTTLLEYGLEIEEIITGQGPVASNGNKLFVNYKGTLENGTVFDSSYVRKTPFDFVLGAGTVISGFDQGLEGMKVGGKRKLIVPPDLAYGSTGSGSIPPNATVTFEVELITSLYNLVKNQYLTFLSH